MVEGAALEMLCTGNRTAGSNPALSAIFYLCSRLSQNLHRLQQFAYPLVSKGFAFKQLARRHPAEICPSALCPLIFSLFWTFSLLRLTYGEFEATP